MADATRTGSDWSQEELDVIVKDYFDMLAADLGRQFYLKSKHNAAVEERIGRSHGSIEFKHQNISAVLDELGMPWIPGYKPRKNYQNAIFDAIDRYLSGHQEFIQTIAAAPTPEIRATQVFVDSPSILPSKKGLPSRLQRLIRKFDPVERDRLNRSLGAAGEEFVLDVEQRRLTDEGRRDLAKNIRWIATEEGDGAGYDILSFDVSGAERLLEVKTTNGSARTPFFLSRNECAVAIERPIDWRIYRVHLFSTDPRIFTISPPLEQTVNLTPETWRASFSGSNARYPS